MARTDLNIRTFFICLNRLGNFFCKVTVPAFPCEIFRSIPSLFVGCDSIADSSRFILKTTNDNIPADIPYLQIDKKLKTQWHNWKKQFEGLKIGINWSGNKDNPAELYRQIPPNVLAPLSEITGITWFNLQKGNNSNRIGQLSKKFNLIETGQAPLEETAALISELDLVITTDTAVAHLSGALGKTVWILLHHAPDWRWLTSGETSHWYPSAKLFRQSSPGHWDEVIDSVYQELLTFTP